SISLNNRQLNVRTGEGHSSKASAEKSEVKIMLITFFDCREIVYQRFLPPNQTNGRSILQRRITASIGSDSLIMEGNMGSRRPVSAA
ncbi:hypothetical protein J6590_050043, partial [Homalodisca vitripennis]